MACHTGMGEWTRSSALPDSSPLQRTPVGPREWDNLGKVLRKPGQPVLFCARTQGPVESPQGAECVASSVPAETVPDFLLKCVISRSRKVLGLYGSLTPQKAFKIKNQSILIFLLSMWLTSTPVCHWPRQAQLSAAARPGAGAGGRCPSSPRTASSGSFCSSG